MAGRSVMSPLQSTLDEYLAPRRALGHNLCDSERLLRRFVMFADHAGAPYITTELALAWATQSATVQPTEWARRRLGV
jgi:integrase/recombinase XerD